MNFLVRCLMILHLLLLGKDQSSTNVYKIKSGIVYYKTRSGNVFNGSETIISFDDYGKKELIKISSRIGREIKVIKIDSNQYTVIDTSQYIRTKRMNKFDPSNPLLSSIDAKTCREYNLKIDSAMFTFLGKDCTRYFFSQETNRVDGEILFWEGIPLRIKVTINGVTTITEAQKLDLNQDLEKNLFLIPASVEIVNGG